MTQNTTTKNSSFGLINTVSELGRLIRAYRKKQNLTLETVSGISHLSMRFISELERGKETAALGKALELIDKLGLEIIVQPRGYQREDAKE